MSNDLERDAREMAKRQNALKQDWSRVLEDQADRIEELEAKLAKAVTDKVRGLTNVLDSQLGTPCEQIRHKEELAELEEILSLRTNLHGEAIYLVEALEAERDALKAKLEAAVEALDQLVIEYDEVDLAHDEPPSMTSAYVVARSTLAKIKGEADR